MSFLKNLFSRSPQASRDTSSPRQVSKEEIEAAWEGTPYLEHLPFAQIMAQGHSKTEILALASEQFDMARQARKRQDADAMILALCVAIALYIIAAEYLDAATALGNFAMVYEQKAEFQIALRLQRYALQLKIDYGAPPEAVAKSYWLIGRAQSALGEYSNARESLQASLSIVKNPRVTQQLS